MARIFGFVGLMITLAIGAWLYSRQVTMMGPVGSTPKQTVDLIGVQNDLIAIANAERRRQALNGTFASLDELIETGDVVVPDKRRGPYEYSSDVGSTSFRIIATYQGEPLEGIPQTVTIDETMQISQE